MIIKSKGHNPSKDFLEKEYQEKIKKIAEEIKSGNTFITKKDQCKKLYDWFCANYSYENEILNHRLPSGRYKSAVPPYSYKGHKIYCHEKYAPILCGKGICIGVSEAFKDICDLLNIECRVVSTSDDDVPTTSPFKKYAHAWNEIIIDGEKSTIDLDPHFQTFMTPPRTKPTFKIHKKTFIIHNSDNEQS